MAERLLLVLDVGPFDCTRKSHNKGSPLIELTKAPSRVY